MVVVIVAFGIAAPLAAFRTVPLMNEGCNSPWQTAGISASSTARINTAGALRPGIVLLEDIVYAFGRISALLSGSAQAGTAFSLLPALRGSP